MSRSRIRVSEIVGVLVASKLPAERPGQSPEVDVLGTVFPVSEELRMYMGSTHTVAAANDRPMFVIMGRGTLSSWVGVEKVEILSGQPDVMLLRATSGTPPFMKLAQEEPSTWNELYVIGYPEDEVVREQGRLSRVSTRGLKGAVTREIEPANVPWLRGPAFEVAFAIPSGMSGSPAFLLEWRHGRRGLIGVCLGNRATSSTLWHEELEETPGQRTVRQEARVVEYGVISRILPMRHEVVRMTGGSLEDLIGYEHHRKEG